MLVLILLFYFVPGTLTGTIPQVSTLFSTNFNAASTNSPSDASPLLSAVPRDISTCTCLSQQRSIWDITWSCLAVILACAWVSVHPDVPAPDEKWWRDSLRRIEYLVWTFLAPEMMVWWAARQWTGARRIRREQNLKHHGWTIAHAHFIQMGGLMLFEGKTRIQTLSYPCFCELLEKGQIQFPDITEREIRDRSKSDGLSKTLVIAQTGWFIMQCIARGVQGLPISELELLTLALAALNGIMYFFWWNKPFGIQCPFPVQLMLPTDFEVSVPEPTSNDEAMDPPTGTIPQTTINDETIDHEVSRPDPPSNDEAKSNSQDQHLQGSAERPLPKSNQMYTFIGVNWSLWRRLITWPWAFALFVAKRLGKMIDSNDNRDKFEATFNNSDDTLGFMRVPIFYSLDVEFADEMSNSVIPLIGTLFGAIHCAAWAFRFPTTAELWLWRLSSIIITVTPLSTALLYVVLRLLQRFSERTSSGRAARTWLEKVARNWSEVRAARTWLVVPMHYLWIAGVAVLISPLPLYIMARLILLAESISTLRDLPPGAFDIVQWTSFLPHI